MSEVVWECGVCLEEFSDDRQPRLLPCGHTLCAVCLPAMAAPGGLTTCPFDRIAHATIEFPINYLALDLIRISKEAWASSKQQQQQPAAAAAAPAPATAIPAVPAGPLGELYPLCEIKNAQGGELKLSFSTAEMDSFSSQAAVIVSYIVDSPPQRGSLGAMCRAYQPYGDLYPLVQRANLATTESLDGGARFGRVETGSNPIFRSLWVLELPVNFSQDTVTAIYRMLRRSLADIVRSSGDGSIFMPLLGVHPTSGITSHDVVEEVLGLMAFAADIGIVGLKEVVLFARSAGAAELCSQISKLQTSRGESLLRSLAQVAGSSEEAKNMYGQWIVEDGGELERLAPVCKEQVDAAFSDLLQEASVGCFSLISAMDGEVQLRTAVRFLCACGRQIAERLVRFCGAGPRANANSEEVARLVTMGLSQNAAEQFLKLVRNGNKAVHTEDVHALSRIDALVSVNAILALARLAASGQLANLNPGGARPAAGAAGAGAAFGAPRTGDWNCEGCGDLQFARNLACRRCGRARAGAVGDAAAAISAVVAAPRGDWNCPGCGDLQFGRNAACRRCGAARPGGAAAAAPAPAAAVPIAGPAAPQRDWNCPGCGDLQFARNDSCRRCGHARPVPIAPAFPAFPPGAAAPAAAPVPVAAPVAAPAPAPAPQGEWFCPTCSDWQFARNPACRKCGRPRGTPAGGAVEPAPPQPNADWFCPGCRDLQFARNKNCRKCGHIRPALVAPAAPAATLPPTGPAPLQGDWNCPGCGDLQFARNQTCRRCGVARPAAVAAAAAPVVAAAPIAAAAPQGDWNCPGCGDLQFARNQSCRRCSHARPGAAASAPLAAPAAAIAAAAPQGDWNCPGCGDLQFARNQSCRRCSHARPGAAASAPLAAGGRGGGRGGRTDWRCAGCGDKQFARNDKCRRCGHARP